MTLIESTQDDWRMQAARATVARLAEEAAEQDATDYRDEEDLDRQVDAAFDIADAMNSADYS